MKKYIIPSIMLLLMGCNDNKITTNIEKETDLVPLYSYPSTTSTEWDKLFLYKHLTNNKVIAIINPSNGDFTQQSLAYDKILKQLHKNSIFAVGYLYTSYGKRNIQDIKKNIDNYKKHYPTIDGYFFDEMERNISKLDYYKEIIQYGKKYSIVNPGTSINQIYIDEKFIDVVVNYEGDYKNREKLNTPNEKTKLAVIYYNAPLNVKTPDNVHIHYFDDDNILKNFSSYLTPKSFPIYLQIAKKTKLQYQDEVYYFPEDLPTLPKEIQFFMDKQLLSIKNCSTQKETFQSLQPFNITKTNVSLLLQITLKAQTNITLLTLQSSNDDTTKLFTIDYNKDNNNLIGTIQNSNNTTTKINLGSYHKNENIELQINNATLNIFIDNTNVFSQNVNYWTSPSIFTFGINPSSKGCNELNITDITIQ